MWNNVNIFLSFICFLSRICIHLREDIAVECLGDIVDALFFVGSYLFLWNFLLREVRLVREVDGQGAG